MKLALWNNGAPQVLRTNKRVGLADGRVVFNAKPAPENDLYAYAEVGAVASRYRKSTGCTYANDGWTITATFSQGYIPLADIRAMRISDIKADAGARILAVLPDWKQRNLTARQSELQAIMAGQIIQPDGSFLAARALDTDEKAELVIIKAAWDWVVAVRQASDDFETAIAAETDAAAAVALQPSWPDAFDPGAGQ